MGIMEKVGAKIATKYGVVTKGRYAGCQIALGNPPSKPVEAAYSFSQIIFVDGTEEKGRYDLRDLGFGLLSSDDRSFQMLVIFGKDDYCEFNLEIRQEDKPLMGMIKQWMGQKTTLGASEQEKLELKYRGVKVFLQNAAVGMVDPENIQFFMDYFAERNILDDLTKKIFELRLKFLAELKEEKEPCDLNADILKNIGE